MNRQITPLLLLTANDSCELRRAYRENLFCSESTERQLQELISASLEGEGSLIRAQLSYRIMIEHQVSRESALSLSVALEYFHLASLLLDDLPCMDDAAYRRGSVCAHIRFDQATAILGSLSLINRAYGLFWSVISPLPAKLRDSCSELIEQCLGVSGLLNGQARDLAYMPETGTEREITEIAIDKTASLFKLTLLLPAKLSGVSAAELHRLSRFSVLFGLCYQLIDDFKDVKAGRSSSGKSSRDLLLNRPNLVIRLGQRAAADRFEHLLRACSKSLRSLEARSLHWSFLWNLVSVLEIAGRSEPLKQETRNSEVRAA